MNLVDARVIVVTSSPYQAFGKWFVEVRFIAWGVEGNTTLMFETKQEAEKVTIGQSFLT